MKLWLLRAREDLPPDPERNPWEPWYDKNFGLVVRAETEVDARRIAQDNVADERIAFTVDRQRIDFEPWLHLDYSTCEELSSDGEPGVILIDHARA